MNDNANQASNDPEEVPPQRKSRRWPWIVGLVVALLAGIGAGAVAQSESEPEVVVQTETVTEEVEVEVEPPDMDERRAGLDELQEELTTLEEELESEGSDLEALREELDERESEITASETEIAENTIPGSGTFLVGDDIQPGTYFTDSDRCYWARLSGFTGQISDVISNGNTRGPAYVTILESDTAFETSRCTEWVKQ